jgi:hypothetical protein
LGALVGEVARGGVSSAFMARYCGTVSRSATAGCAIVGA